MPFSKCAGYIYVFKFYCSQTLLAKNLPFQVNRRPIHQKFHLFKMCQHRLNTCSDCLYLTEQFSNVSEKIVTDKVLDLKQ